MNALVRIASLILLTIWIVSLPVSALSMTDTYQYSGEKTSIPAPAAYTVKAVIFGQTVDEIPFRDPADMFVDSHNMLYIVDSGNNRILVLDEQYQLMHSITELF